MIERLRMVGRYGIPIVAVVVMVVGLWPQGTAPSADARVEAIASNIKCPACGGASVSDAESGIARDFYVVIADQVATGMSDGEIYDYWTARFGEQALLSPPTRGWGLLLWILPVAGVALGVAAVAGLRRRGLASSTPDEPASEAGDSRLEEPVP
jgi:cytochrome c-type biogenesis protein CcmH